MSILQLAIYWDPSREIIKWNIPFLGRPILWYGVFFALGFFLGYQVFKHLLLQFLRPYRVRRATILKLAEKVSIYVIIGALVGARLGDIFFYQDPSQYMHDPLGIFRFWEGGLSSHGGVIGILLSLWIFCQKIRKKYPMLSWIALLDLLAIPALLAGGFIRIGNFFNQEILGTVTNVPWAVIFGHPADGSAVVPRHPAQLYEALFYFGFFAVLWALRAKVPKMYRLGKTSGLFFIAVFAFRFLIEFVKAPQSVYLAGGAFWDMGQFLSIPLILIGLCLFFCEHKSVRARSVKRH